MGSFLRGLIDEGSILAGMFKFCLEEILRLVFELVR